MSYNGYRNRQTWNVVLWLMNTEGLYRECVRFARLRRVTSATAKPFVERFFGDVTPDGDSLKGVHWAAVARAINEAA